MAKLIAITGTHGTGKTTLSFLLAAEYKKLGANVKIIQEVARSCPFPLNAEMTVETAHWIYHEHSKKEIEACRDHDVVICDRTSFDSFIYAECMDLDINIGLKDSALSHLHDYEYVYFIRPDKDINPDNVRSIDPDFQLKIDRLFEHHYYRMPVWQLMSSTIFDKGQTWNISL